MWSVQFCWESVRGGGATGVRPAGSVCCAQAVGLLTASCNRGMGVDTPLQKCGGGEAGGRDLQGPPWWPQQEVERAATEALVVQSGVGGGGRPALWGRKGLKGAATFSHFPLRKYSTAFGAFPSASWLTSAPTRRRPMQFSCSGLGVWSRISWVQTPAPPPIGCVTSNK